MSSILGEIWLLYQIENFSSVYLSNNKSLIYVTPAHLLWDDKLSFETLHDCKSVLFTISSNGSMHLPIKTLLPMVVKKTVVSFCV